MLFHRRDGVPPATNTNRRRRGLTLIELIVALTILLLLSGAAVPIARVRIRYEKERELKRNLQIMRDAIDRYKNDADNQRFQIKLGTEGYPPDLDTLVNGVEVNGKKVRYLRQVPMDPMTGRAEWGTRCLKDEPKSESWCGDNVFDVYSKSPDTATDGSKYSEW